jgi:glycosyltransferase involved in cell wall biosynthesis
MRQADADVYVFRGKPRNAPFVYLLSRLLRAKWVYNIANDANLGDRRQVLPLPLREFHDFALEHADLVVLQTEKQKRMTEATFDANTTVIPNGYPVPDSIPGLSEREYFLWVGTMDDVQKRPHLFLDLAERIPDEEFCLVGPCDETSDYQRRVMNRAEGLANVELAGEVPPEEIHEYYQNAIALVNTSAFEGFPNTYLEAWRYDTPVVGLEVDPGRFVEPDVDAFADGDMERLERMITELSVDNSMKRALGGVPGEYVRSKLSLELIASRYASEMMDLP